MKSIYTVQVMYALLIPLQIFSALKFQNNEVVFGWIIVFGVMVAEIVGIKYWIKAQTEEIQQRL